MSWRIQRYADQTHDAELASDVGDERVSGIPAAIGDSISFRSGKERIKLTLLDVIDPAPVTEAQLSEMLEEISESDRSHILGADKSDCDPSSDRYLAVKIKARHLDLALSVNEVIVHTGIDGVLMADNGAEYMSRTGARVVSDPIASVPSPGEPTKVGWVVFKLPVKARPVSVRLAIDGYTSAVRNRSMEVPAGEWLLERRQEASETVFERRTLAEVLQRGMETWNSWRKQHSELELSFAGASFRRRALRSVDFSHMDLTRTDFTGADLSGANLEGADARNAIFADADLEGANLRSSNLERASFVRAYAVGARFTQARLQGANLDQVNAHSADFSWADLSGTQCTQASLGDCRAANAVLIGADLTEALLMGADLRHAKLVRAKMHNAYLTGAQLTGANLEQANCRGANLHGADLTEALVDHADLSMTNLVEATLEKTRLSQTRIYGIAAWNVKGMPTQNELIITRPDQPRVTVNDLEVAQFIHLLLDHKRLREVFNAVTERGVLLLGRFGGGGLALLRLLAKELSDRGYVPIIFDFDVPADRNYTETVKTLVGMSRFVVVDLSGPSVPQELCTTIPFFKIPFVPIIERGSRPYSPCSSISWNMSGC